MNRLLATTVVGAQLGLILLIAYTFEVAARIHFFPVLCLSVAGFLVHVWLPERLRPAFFPLLCVGGVMAFLGWPNGAWVLGIGGGLIGVCYLPIALGARVLLISVAAIVLAFLRLDVDRAFWPVLGSMFMFRMIVYLFEARRARENPPLALTVAYFFPLPNLCFLFFPIIDFQTFRETYRPSASWHQAQAGVGWIVRGLSHLLAYRIIKYYFLPAPHQLGELPYLALFLAANYALYLHVSGIFHIITGMFHLFGFELPRTHHNYFLASSFTDVWRRINVYWKDFMTKVFFLPAFFALRGWGTGVAVAVAAVWVFVATWLLHVYQVFWITGGLDVNPEVALLWLGASVFVAWNLQRDLARAGRRRAAEPAASASERASDPRSLALAAGSSQLWSAACHALQVVGMFVLISLFWAGWNAPMVFPFLQTQLTAGTQALPGVLLVAGVLLGVVCAGVAAQLVRERLHRLHLVPRTPSPAVSALALLTILTLVALAPHAALGDRAAGVVALLRREADTPVEAAMAVQGYYEEMLNARVPTGAWLAALQGRPKPLQTVTYTTMSRPTDDLLERELIPGWSGEVDGSSLTVNRLGLRDRADRAQAKPPDTQRIAAVGSSVVMGYGVGDDEAFPLLLEDRLNARRQPGEPLFEVLNFGTGKSYAIHRRVLIDRKVLAFRPDAIFYVAHQDEMLGTVQHLAKLLERRVKLPYPCLDDVLRKAGITPDTPTGEAHALLQTRALELIDALYRDLVKDCRQRGIVPVWVYVPMPGVAEAPARQEGFVRLAREAGFEVVDLTDWADGRRAAEVRRGQADQYHPNALGHRLIAERLDTALQQRPGLLRRR